MPGPWRPTVGRRGGGGAGAPSRGCRALRCRWSQLQTVCTMSPGKLAHTSPVHCVASHLWWASGLTIETAPICCAAYSEWWTRWAHQCGSQTALQEQPIHPPPNSRSRRYGGQAQELDPVPTVKLHTMRGSITCAGRVDCPQGGCAAKLAHVSGGNDTSKFSTCNCVGSPDPRIRETSNRWMCGRLHTKTRMKLQPHRCISAVLSLL